MSVSTKDSSYSSSLINFLNNSKVIQVFIIFVIFMTFLIACLVSFILGIKYSQIVRKSKSAQNINISQKINVKNDSKIDDPSYIPEDNLLKPENYFYWKTYTNPAYHYSIQYPAFYDITLCSGCEDPNGTVFITARWANRKYYGKITLNGWYLEGKTYKELFNQMVGMGNYLRGATDSSQYNNAVIVGDNTIFHPELDEAEKLIVFTKGNQVVEFWFNTNQFTDNKGLKLSEFKNLPLYEKMAKSFRFTD